jgi:secreted trypsin-like serine protease
MDIVLTAAHCLHNKGSELIEIEDLTIILGALDLNETEEIRRQTRKASKFTIHQDWSVTTSKYNDDIAIIKLKDPVNYTIFVRPICLWKSDLNDFQNIPSVGTVSGWGATEIYGGFVNKARIVEVPILELTKCLLEKDLINRIAWNKSFCAGNDNFGVLRGDSGSALTLKIGEKNYLKGLVSSSISVPSKASFLAVYADVTLYDDFIKVKRLFNLNET